MPSSGHISGTRPSLRTDLQRDGLAARLGLDGRGQTCGFPDLHTFDRNVGWPAASNRIVPSASGHRAVARRPTLLGRSSQEFVRCFSLKVFHMLVPLAASQSSVELPVTITVAPPPCRLAGRLSGGRQGGDRAPADPGSAGDCADRPSRPMAWSAPSTARVVRSGAMMVDGYVRSWPSGAWGGSRESVERALIGAWAVHHGCRVRCVFQEPASGGIDSPRSLLRQVLERVESRESDGVVVARLTSSGSLPGGSGFRCGADRSRGRSICQRV